jgi:hypothetical protein
MDKHSLTAKNSLGHLLRGLPADSDIFAKHRAVFEEAIELLKDVLAKCQEEAHKALKATVPNEVACPCNRCKANAYIEVIQALPYDELLELIMYGDVAEGSELTDCCLDRDARASARPSGGAGESSTSKY